jgi:uncharacterized protein
MTTRILRLNVALTSLAFAACVTINVYFPAAAAEQAADQVINTVTSGSGASAPNTGASGGTQTSPPPRSQLTGSRQDSPTPVLLVAAGRVLEWLVPAAQAQSQANVDISSPSVRAIVASMQGRFDQLKPYLASGAIGVTANALIEIRDNSLVPIAERANAKRLVAEENADRATLYAEIAKANGHPEWEGDIRGVFAQRWIARAKQEGWYQQDGSGGWSK